MCVNSMCKCFLLFIGLASDRFWINARSLHLFFASLSRFCCFFIHFFLLVFRLFRLPCSAVYFESFKLITLTILDWCLNNRIPINVRFFSFWRPHNWNYAYSFPVISLGFSHPFCDNAIQNAVRNGVSFIVFFFKWSRNMHTEHSEC